jgi:hypothetical protein
LHCPRAASKPCTLTGTNLFLVSAVAAAPDFENAVEIPAEFTGVQVAVPHPANGTLYIRLRDDPATVQTLALPVIAQSAGAAAGNTAPAPGAAAGAEKTEP